LRIPKNNFFITTATEGSCDERSFRVTIRALGILARTVRLQRRVGESKGPRCAKRIARVEPPGASVSRLKDVPDNVGDKEGDRWKANVYAVQDECHVRATDEQGSMPRYTNVSNSP
jgi:hypothetical protein